MINKNSKLINDYFVLDCNLLLFAVENNNKDIVKELLKHPKIKINEKGFSGISPLLMSVIKNNIEIVECFLKNKETDINIKSYSGTSPLLQAVRDNNLPIVKLLLDNGADVNITANTYLKITPLQEILMSDNINNIAVIKLLLIHSYYDVNLEYLLKKIEKNKNNEDKIKIILNKIKLLKTKLYKNLKDVIVKKRIEDRIREILKITLSDMITKTDLGEISDNNSQTILNRVINLNPFLYNYNIQIKTQENSITKTSAIIFTNNEYFPGNVVVNFIIFEKSNDKQKINTKNDNSNISIGNKPGTSGIQNIKNEIPYKKTGGQKIKLNNINIQNIKNENNNYDVRSDGGCLFWAVASAYLLPVRNNNQEFKNRFINLFGKLQLSYLSYVQNLYKEFDLENHSSIQNLYQDSTMYRLISDFFRNRVVDYTESHLDTIINNNGELTLRNLIEENNEIDYSYLERMRQPST